MAYNGPEMTRLAFCVSRVRKKTKGYNSNVAKTKLGVFCLHLTLTLIDLLRAEKLVLDYHFWISYSYPEFTPRFGQVRNCRNRF